MEDLEAWIDHDSIKDGDSDDEQKRQIEWDLKQPASPGWERRIEYYMDGNYEVQPYVATVQLTGETAKDDIKRKAEEQRIEKSRIRSYENKKLFSACLDLNENLRTFIDEPDAQGNDRRKHVKRQKTSCEIQTAVLTFTLLVQKLGAAFARKTEVVEEGGMHKLKAPSTTLLND